MNSPNVDTFHNPFVVHQNALRLLLYWPDARINHVLSS